MFSNESKIIFAYFFHILLTGNIIPLFSPTVHFPTTNNPRLNFLFSTKKILALLLAY